MRLGWEARKASNRLLQVAIFAAVGLIVAYSIIYFQEPFSDFTNLLLADTLTVMSAVVSATAATLICATLKITRQPYGSQRQCDITSRIKGIHQRIHNT